MKKLSNIKLIAIFGVLVIIYLAITFLGGSSRSKSFRDSLVDIDTSRVTRIVITKGGQVTEMVKDDGSWQLPLSNGKKVTAVQGKVTGFLSSLITIKPSRVVSRDQSKWGEYNVDSTGVQVQVYEGSKKTLDIIIGRFGIKGQREFYSHVRLIEDNSTYISDGFMGLSLSTDINSFRNNQVLKITTDSVSAVSFNYPDSSFQLTKSAGGNWEIADQQVDSTSIAEFFRDVRYLNSSLYYDDLQEFMQPSHSVEFTLNGEVDQIFNAALVSDELWVFNSTLNPESYFSDSTLLKKVFVSRKELLGQ